MSFRIKELWAYVSVAPDGDEGVIGTETPNGWIPLVAADGERVKQFRDVAAYVAARTGRPVRLVHFTNRSDVETIGAS